MVDVDSKFEGLMYRCVSWEIAGGPVHLGCFQSKSHLWVEPVTPEVYALYRKNCGLEFPLSPRP